MRICILYGGVSKERKVSIASGKSIMDALRKDEKIFGYDFDGNYNNLLSAINDADLVFNALHGGDGEDGTMQKFLTNNNIRFTGSNYNASRNAMDKHAAKTLCLESKILTPNWLYYKKNIGLVSLEVEILRFYNKDIVIKPSDEGSSIGLSIIENFDSKNKHKRKMLDESISKCYKVSRNVLIEEYIDGRELTVGILGNKILPIVEIVPNNNYYDYECKYTKGMSSYIVPAKNISKTLESDIYNKAMQIYDLMGCRHYARIDFRLSKDNYPYFLEVNTLPGFTDTSLFPMAAKALGISYKNLLLKIIELAKK
ncbi:MAG: D-alanine--D-alanine ligase [Candidatus Marinimicrobia bacterium]|nr:D-alanine--D-alanine ligase [Candidatus Neomarinimicrobiota bacterium]